jgi:hypothetical protein
MHKNPPHGNNSGSTTLNPRYTTKVNFQYENVIEMKSKTDPALLRTSYLSKEIQKGHQNRVNLDLVHLAM